MHSLKKTLPVFLAIAVVFFGLGVSLSESGATRAVAKSIPFLNDSLNATPEEDVDLTSFWKVWNTLDERFVDTTSSSTMPTSRDKVYAALEGLARSYGDPYTVFMPPEDTKMFKEEISGSFGGVGMEIGLDKDGIVTVITPLKGTPAERAGILAGDLILKINASSTEGFTTESAVRLIRGEKGTTVTFLIARGDERKEISVVRDTIQVPTIDNYKVEGKDVYVIELYSFTANSPELFEKAIREFNQTGLKNLVIDLRGNPGGYLNAAIHMASHFIAKDAIVVTEDYDGKQPSIVHRSSGTGLVANDVQTVVLLNKGSASASEILAGALRDHKRATIIGETSFGKGSVQELIDVDGASLKVTVARWMTPAGLSISHMGVPPDIEVIRTEEEIMAEKDSQKDKAVEFLLQN